MPCFLQYNAVMKKSEKPSGRSGRKPVQFYMDEELHAALNAYLDSKSEDEKPTLTAILQVSLKTYLKGKGFWPPPKEDSKKA